MAPSVALTSTLWWLLALAPLGVVGAVLVWDRSFERRELGSVGVVLIALINGMVLVTSVMLGFSFLAIRWQTAAVVAVSAGASLILRRLTRHDAFALRPAASLVGRGKASLFAGACAIASIAAAWITTIAGKASSPDLLWFWGPKGQHFAAVQGIDPEFLRNPLLAYMHPAYPPLITNLYAWLALVSGGFSWRAVTLLFPIVLTVTWLMLRSLWVRQNGVAVGEMLAAMAAGSMSLIGIKNSFGGIAEMPLLFFELSGVSLLCLRRGTATTQLWAGLSLAGAALTKVEGVAVALPAIGAFVAMQPARARARAALLTGGPLIVGLLCWFGFGKMHHIFVGYSGYGPLFAVDWALLPRVIEGMTHSLGSVAAGLPYWIPVVAAVGLRRADVRMLVPLAAAVGLLGFLVFTYLHGGPDPYEWIAWSCGRVLSPIPGLLLISLSLGYPGWESFPQAATTNGGTARAVLPVGQKEQSAPGSDLSSLRG